MQSPVVVARDPGAGGKGSGTNRPWGDTLIAGTDWFGGHGVDVKSNGPDLGRYCVDPCGTAATGRLGYAFQCVELVETFLHAQGWITSLIPGNAWAIYANAPADKFTKHPAGDGYHPVPGDVLVWHGGWGNYGHVAVVEWVAGDRVGYVEQNASATGRSNTTISSNSARLGNAFTGYLHANANPAGTNAGTPSANANAAVTGASRSPELIPFTGGRRLNATWGDVSGGYHATRYAAIDIDLPVPAPVYAAGDGVIDKVGTDPRNCNPYAHGNLDTGIAWCTKNNLIGTWISIRHPDTTFSRYFHLSSIVPGVGVGVTVHAGQQIAMSGNSGISTAPHLHYEERSAAGAYLDPGVWTGCVNGARVDYSSLQGRVRQIVRNDGYDCLTPPPPSGLSRADAANHVLRVAATGTTYLADGSGTPHWIPDAVTYRCVIARGASLLDGLSQSVVDALGNGQPTQAACMNPTEAANHVLRVAATGTAYLADATGVPHWIPDGGTYDCLVAKFPLIDGLAQGHVDSIGNGQPWATCTTGPGPVDPPRPAPTTWSESTVINSGVNTFTNYHNASGVGPHIDKNVVVQVSCKVLDGTIQSVNPDGYWYRIASSPWNNAYYSPANTFLNGDPAGGPYSRNTDWAVPNC